MNQPKSANSLPVINIATPCPRQWNEMQGDESKRFCDHCTKNVFNFAEMPRDEVSELIASGDRVCARIFRRADGSIITRDDKPSRKRSSFIRSWIQRAAICAAGIVSLMTFGGCEEETVRRAIPWLPEQEEEVTGIVAPGAELGDIAMPEPGELAPPEIGGAVPVEVPAETQE